MEKGKLYNLAWALFEKIISIILTVVMTASIARYFGVELFGQYQYSLSILFVATALTWLCPAESLYSKVNVDGGIDDDVVVTSIIYRFLICFSVWLLVVLYNIINTDSSFKLYSIIILTIPLLYTEPLGIFRFILECKGMYYITSRIRLGFLILKVIITIAFIYFKFNPLIVLTPLLIETILSSLIFYFFYSKLLSKEHFKNISFDMSIAKKFLIDGIKLWGGLVFMSVFLKLDRFLLEPILEKNIFGYYSTALSVLEQLNSLSGMLLAVLGPVLIYRAKQCDLKVNILKLSSVTLVLGLISSIFMFWLGKYFIIFVYGEKFEASILIFKSIIFVLPIVFVDAVLNAYIIKSEANIIFFIKWGLALLTAYIIMNYYIKSLGWLGGVCGYYAGYSVALLISVVYFLLNQKNDTIKKTI